jgi:hypothetical protein
VIWCYTRFLSDADAAHADAVLAAAAPQTRADLLARRAARLEMKLDPEATRQRKEQARKTGRRVEARREASGNACLAGRELDVADVIAAKACIDADAVALRNGGLDGTLDELRALAYTDRLQRKNPLDRLTRTPAAPAAPAAPGEAPRDDTAPAAPGTPGEAPRDDTAPGGGDEGGDEGGPGGPGGGGPKGSGTPGGGLAPPPALITVLVPAGTLLGWSHAPGEAGTWGLLDAGDTRALVQAASAHPRTRWAVTVTGPDGTARAHGRARGPHPWAPEPGGNGARGSSPGGSSPATPPQRRSPRTGRRPGRPARRPAAAAERHAGPDRPRQLRPPPPRGPLHPRPRAQGPHPRPHRDLLGARLRRPGDPLRPGPHHRLPVRHHLRMRAGTGLPPAS